MQIFCSFEYFLDVIISSFLYYVIWHNENISTLKSEMDSLGHFNIGKQSCQYEIAFAKISLIFMGELYTALQWLK